MSAVLSEAVTQRDRLLRDVALKARAVVIDELSDADLWLKRSRVNLIQGDQRARGAAFVTAVLGEYLGRKDFALLNSETIFGYSRHGLRSRLPTIAGFGLELGSGFHKWLGNSISSRTQSSRLCGIFFVGTALFDLVCDTRGLGAESLLSVFDLAILRDMLAEPDAGGQRLETSGLWAVPEFRILFKIITLFFNQLRALSRDSDNEDLSRLIEQCYLAQLHSVLPAVQDGSVDCLRAHVDQKSILPFVIMFRLVQISSGIHEINRGGEGACLEEIATRLGRVLWRIDDVADLGDDLSSDAANSIVARATFEGCPSDAESVARYLLQSSLLAEVAREIRSELRHLITRLSSRNIRMDGSWTFEHWVLAAVRGWVEPRTSGP
jgi:hypothetical protein